MSDNGSEVTKESPIEKLMSETLTELDFISDSLKALEKSITPVLSKPNDEVKSEPELITPVCKISERLTQIVCRVKQMKKWVNAIIDRVQV